MSKVPYYVTSIMHNRAATKVMSDNFQPSDPARYQAALNRFDRENSADPNRVMVVGRPEPRELVYARWLSDWVLRLAPRATEALRLAARCQHLCRWKVPRESYPQTRAGYLQWRERLKGFHAEAAGEILSELGYPAETIARVQDLNRKRNLAHDPEVQTLEDALCLVFLQRQFGDLASRTSEDKMIAAVRKTWHKMSSQGREMAQTLEYTATERALLERALASDQNP